MTIPGTALRVVFPLALFAMVPAAVSAAILPLDLTPSMVSTPAPAGGSPFDAVEGSDRSDISSHRDGSRSFRLSELKSVSIGGSDYYAFLLDARDAAPGHLKEQSLDALRLYIADRGDFRSLEAVAAGGTLGWEMPTGDGVKWPWGAGDASLRRGTDRRVILIAQSAFNGVDPDRYLYLYSRLNPTHDGGGDPRGRVDEGRGPSDWHALETGTFVAEPPSATGPSFVAEPPMLLLVGTGMLAAASVGKRRRR